MSLDGLTKQDFSARLYKYRQAYNIYNLFKTKACIQDFSKEQEAAFRLIPFFLHGCEPKQFGYTDGKAAPFGVHGFKWNERIRFFGRRFFSSRDNFTLPPRVNSPAIEFLSLMGSVGSIAYTDSSDFDYWCCVRPDLGHSERQALQRKLTKIEKWAEEILKVEVHFFMTDRVKLQNNDFGQVTAESCGTALGKLLKEEYYRGSLHICGKVPLWWLLPPGADDKEYRDTVKLIQKHFSELDDNFIDIGNISGIPLDEFLGGGMWQINKGITSPFKSALKMALLVEYCDPETPEFMLANQLKKQVQTNPNRLEFLDPYQFLIERVLSYYAKKQNWEVLDLLRTCLYLKVGPRVSRWFDSKRAPDNKADRVMTYYCKKWKWDIDRVLELEMFDRMSIRKAMNLKHTFERFMFDSLHQLKDISSRGGIQHSVSPEDYRKMTQRLTRVYSPEKGRAEWMYPPFNKFILSSHFTLQHLHDEDRLTGRWNLYLGPAHHGEQPHEDLRIRNNDTISTLICWMLYNNLVHPDTKFHYIGKGAVNFTTNLNELSDIYRDAIGKATLPDLDEPAFNLDPAPRRFLASFNLIPTESLEELPDLNLGTEEQTQTGETRMLELTSLITEELQDALSRVGHISKAQDLSKEETGTFLDAHEYTQMLTPESAEKLHELDKTQQGKEIAERLRQLPLRAGIMDIQADPLNAGPHRVSCLFDILLFQRNTWDEVTTREYGGKEWLTRFLRDFFQRCLDFRLNPEDVLQIHIGRGRYDLPTVRRRVVKTLNRIFAVFNRFVEAKKSNKDAVFSYILEVDGSTHFLSCAVDDRFRTSRHADLHDAFAMMSLLPSGEVHMGYDSARGQLYETLGKLADGPGTRLLMHTAGPAVFFLIVDESRRPFSLTVPKEELNFAFPKLVFSVLAAMRHRKGFKPSPYPLKVLRLEMHAGNKYEVEDISSQSHDKLKKVKDNIKPLSMFLPRSSAIRVLHVAAAGGNIFHIHDTALHLHLVEMLSTLRGWRKGKPKGAPVYRVCLTDVKIIRDESSKDSGFPSSTCSMLYLKTALEDALTFQLNLDREKELEELEREQKKRTM